MSDPVITVDAREVTTALHIIGQRALEAGRRGVEDSIDEIVKISSEITPLDRGILQHSHSTDIAETPAEIKGQVEYSVNEATSSGEHVNYALRMHEGVYSLGPLSLLRPGTTGWSGTNYRVGNKYLERPLKGEEKAILKHISDLIKQAIGG